MWKDEYEKLLHTASGAAAVGFGGFLVGFVKGIIHNRYGGFWQWLALMLGTVFVAIIAGYALDASDLSANQQRAVIGIAAYLADDILIALVSVSGMFRKDPFGVVDRALNVMWGRRKGDRK